jgi:hypothetical protein
VASLETACWLQFFVAAFVLPNYSCPRLVCPIVCNCNPSATGVIINSWPSFFINGLFVVVLAIVQYESSFDKIM